jgi:glucokinase
MRPFKADIYHQAKWRGWQNFGSGVMGDFALALGATGGIYVGGGIMPRLVPLIDRSVTFRRLRTKAIVPDDGHACQLIIEPMPGSLRS